jgi:uncharacterized repeat protein (TIGR01451 family)
MLDVIAITTSLQANAFVLPGEPLTYTLVLTNSSLAATIHQVQVTNTMPSAVQFITATMPYTQDGDTINWSWATLTAGQSQTVTLVVQVPAEIDFSPLVDQVVVSSAETETMADEVETAVLYIKKYFPVLFKEP